MKQKRTVLIAFMFCFGLLFFKQSVCAQDYFEATIQQNDDKSVLITITPNQDVEFDGFDIYRTDAEGGEYQYIGTVESGHDYEYDYDIDDDYDDWYDDWYDVEDLVYIDTTVLNSYQTYYYRIEGYQLSNEIKTDLNVIKQTDAMKVFKWCLVTIGLAYAGNYIGSIISMIINGDDVANNQQALETIFDTNFAIPMIFIVDEVMRCDPF